jgi:glycosyltransferase involved in cell wall biosynthesis
VGNADGLRPPLISVIIPAYNYGRFISQAIESVRVQTYANWECIVVDDGSSDNTQQVVAHSVGKDGRFRYVRQENAGLAAARNTGIAHSKGDYVQFLDADDLLESRKLERQIEFLKQHNDVDIVYGDVRYFRTGNPEQLLFSQSGENAPWVVPLSAKGKDVLLTLLKNNFMVVSSPLLRRSVVTDVGLFDGGVKGVEDWDYWLRCAIRDKRFHFQDTEDSRTLIRIHPNSMSTDARLMLRSTLRMHRQLDAAINDREASKLNRERMAERVGFLGIEEIAAGQMITGIRQLCRSAMMDRRLRYKAKWLLCAASAPFVSNERLRGMVSSSLTGSVAEVFDKLDLKKSRGK